MHQPACKPGSVGRGLGPPRDGHSSATPVARRLRQPTRTAGSGHRSRPPPSRVPRRPYSVLLPVGFAVPPALPQARCALTAPFHPCRAPPDGWGLGGLFSVALSLGLRPPDVIRHRMSMEPGLSSRAHLSALARAAVQPTDVRWNGGYGERGQAPHANQALGWIELRSSRAARSVLSVAMVDTSITPSMRSGRKWRWNAATASRVAPSR